VRCYAPAIVLVLFALLVTAGVNPGSALVLVTFLVFEAIAVVVYITDIRRRFHRGMRDR
jgi:hypothetical protein